MTLIVLLTVKTLNKKASTVNFNKNTNYKQRTKLYEKLEDKEWSIIKIPF